MLGFAARWCWVFCCVFFHPGCSWRWLAMVFLLDFFLVLSYLTGILRVGAALVAFFCPSLVFFGRFKFFSFFLLFSSFAWCCCFIEEGVFLFFFACRWHGLIDSSFCLFVGVLEIKNPHQCLHPKKKIGNTLICCCLFLLFFYCCCCYCCCCCCCCWFFFFFSCRI